MWYTLGILSLGMAYIGVITPGIPFSHFLVFSAYCFAKSSQKMHNWLYNHKHFGPFLTNWNEKRIFPTRGKYMMVATMTSTVLFTWYVSPNPMAPVYSGIFMAIIAIFVWLRYPGNEAEWERKHANK